MSDIDVQGAAPIGTAETVDTSEAAEEKVVDSSGTDPEIAWEDLTGDGGVKKRTICKGSGEMPCLHAVCLVHYVGKHKEDGAIFADTKNDKNGSPVTVVAGRDSTRTESGLSKGVHHMVVGEICELEIAPQYAYGEKGSFSFPSVKPSATVVYEVELLGASPPVEKEKMHMFFEERLEAAQRVRFKGNELFSQGDIQGAIAQNTMALDYVDEDFMFQLREFHLYKAQEVKAPLLLNIAAGHLRLENWQDAISAATDALAVTNDDADAQYAKALFRRAKARKELQQTDEALQDLENALKRCPDDKLIAQEILKVRKQQKEEQRAVDNLFRNRFPSTAKKEETEAAVEETDHADTRETREKLTVGEKWFFACGQFLHDLIMKVLRMLGLVPPASRT